MIYHQVCLVLYLFINVILLYCWYCCIASCFSSVYRLRQEIVPKAASDIPGCCAPRTQAEDAKCKELGDQRTAWEEYDACASAADLNKQRSVYLWVSMGIHGYTISPCITQMVIWIKKMYENDNDQELDSGAPYFQANSNIQWKSQF